MRTSLPLLATALLGVAPLGVLPAQAPATRPTGPAAARVQKIREVMSPARQWRLAAALDAFPAVPLREGDRRASDGGDQAMGRIGVRLTAPTRFFGGTRWALTNEAQYDRLQFGSEGAACTGSATSCGRPDDPRAFAYHTVRYDLGLSRQLNAQWRLSGLARTELLTGGQAPRLSDVRLTGAVMALKQARPTLQWGLGLAVLNIETPVIPAARLLWTDGARWRADVLLPQRAELWREFHPRLELGVVGRFNANTYVLPDARIQDGRVLRRVSRLEYGEGTAAAALLWKVGAHWTVNAEAGGALLRDADFFATGRRETTSRTAVPEMGPFLRLALRWTQ